MKSSMLLSLGKRARGVFVGVSLLAPQLGAQTRAAFPEEELVVTQPAPPPPPRLSLAGSAGEPRDEKLEPSPTEPVKSTSVERAPSAPLAPVVAPVGRGLAFRPPALPAYGDLPPPPGYVLEDRMNSGVFWTGLITFGAIYGASIVYGASQDFEQGLGYTVLPLVGPWLAVGQRSFSCSLELSQQSAEACQEAAVEEATSVVALSALGIGQALGATLALVGLFDRDQRWVRLDLQGASLTLDTMYVRGTGGGLILRGNY